MSRCFPYPPPGYSLSRSKDDALIESIKLQKEKEKAQKKKEKKRVKREKRKEKKEEEKRKEKKEEKRKENKETEQLERSSVSEEHGEPVYSYAPSSSSVGTECSNKRKRHSSPIHSSHGHGNIIKIRLNSKKQNEPDSLANEHGGCSTSGRTDFPPLKEDTGLRDLRDNIHCTNIGQHYASEADGEQICSTSKPFGAIASCKTGIPSVPNVAMSKMQKEELWFKDLVENLVPLHSLTECFEPDEDWLFEDRRVEIKRQRCGNDGMSFSSKSGLWPRAQYLKEANLHALPFSVPF